MARGRARARRRRIAQQGPGRIQVVRQGRRREGQPAICPRVHRSEEVVADEVIKDSDSLWCDPRGCGDARERPARFRCDPRAVPPRRRRAR